MYDDGSGSGLLQYIPPIRRARGYRLYTGDGRRFLDLWQYGGRALLGHNPPGMLQVLKNTASRGLFAPFFDPTGLGRLEKALGRLFPGREFRVYRDDRSLEAALEAAGYRVPADKPLLDPAFALKTDPAASGGITLWRPFLSDDPSRIFTVPEDQPVLMPVLPLPLEHSFRVLALDASAAAAFPGSDPVSPVLLSAAARVVHTLAGEGQALRSWRNYSAVDRALQNGPWKRTGIYLVFQNLLDEEAYKSLFLRFLEAGFILPPTPDLPAILPGEMSPGEAAKLIRMWV
ncbi:hypothetical protein [Breznakiella homolactica]|uniref:Uncharacterized protein n=1 Tax=Breznakiella homolactica TaxID=2798577 RepID=A0A7T7XNY1_9SPIR|nr:hypothetical protein [Breznakiella homolactica]QQO09712.1 hypothetical protein JFL75_01990 [Breznakiella homolactica]